jgi:hypothetical protein
MIPNEGVIRYLRRGNAAEFDRSPRPEGRDYWEAGSHPDVVERVWDQLGRGLPVESKRVVCGSPALVHPPSKVLIAVAMGTQYAVRLPASVLQAGGPATVRTTNIWSDGTRMDIRAEFGADWIFGSYSPDEETWCRQWFESATIRG